MPYDPLSPEQREIRELVRTLARERIAPRAAEIDKSAEFPWDMVELMRRARALRAPVRRGATAAPAPGALMVLVAIEELSKVCATTGLILAVQELGSLGLKLAGTDEQKERYLPRLASGEWLAAYALTEPGSGSDSAAMRTEARLDGDDYVLNGVEALHHQRRRRAPLHRLRQDRPRRPDTPASPRSWSRRTRPGSRSGGSSRRWASRAPPPARSFSTAAASRRTTCLGEEGEGFKIAMRILDRSRPGVGGPGARARAGSHRLRARVREDAGDHGPADLEHQLVAGMLADMETKCEAARGLLYKVGLMIDEGATATS